MVGRAGFEPATNGSKGLAARPGALCGASASSRRRRAASRHGAACCVHQWMKNLLLFMPLVAAHQVAQADAWITLVLAFVSFSLCASSFYIANDLLDLESDARIRASACGRSHRGGAGVAGRAACACPAGRQPRARRLGRPAF